MPAWWSEAGGVPYHLRALKNRNEGWIPHRLELEKRLRGTFAQYHPEQILWIGLSGAHELSTEMLRSFRVPQFAIEPDPLARAILRWKKLEIELDARPLTESESLRMRIPEALHGKRTWISFANLLGQVPGVPWNWSLLFEGLSGVATSWHDRFSSSEPGVLVDHECVSPFPGQDDYAAWSWSLTPKNQHEIEWGRITLGG